ncbi:hypothetical protein GpartN1_g4789.t1 [Galdieria partita]|uniref:Methyltransferase domain-containing protein n=1 Tax=Galdieria partita TaxID=83374 RepID=A0A9C7URJ6_9RHOD|nr:hypothetical protein GpartN1_g4789.t1 [Galdieria partita]
MSQAAAAFKRAEEEKWSRAGERRWQLFKRLEKDNATANFFLKNEAIFPGAKVLELACGSGETTLQVAAKVRGYSIPSGQTTGEVVDKLLEMLHPSQNSVKPISQGATGSVVGVDIAKGMLNIFQNRLENTVLKEHVKLVESDIEEYVMPKEHFDVVISQYSIPHFPNAVEVLKNVRQSLVPNTGKFVTVIWGPVPQCDIFSIPKKFLGDPHGHHHHHHHHDEQHHHHHHHHEHENAHHNDNASVHCHCGSPQHTLKQIETAGFHFTTMEFPVVYDFASASDYLYCLSEMNQGMKEYMGEPGSEKWRQVESYVKENNSIQLPDGSLGIRLNNIAIGILAEP